MRSFVSTFLQDVVEADNRKNKSIATISLIGAIAAWLALPAYLFASYLTGAQQFLFLTYNNVALAIGLTIAHVLARLKIKWIPIWLTGLLVEATFIIVNFHVQGLGIILAVVLLAIIANIALQNLALKPAIVMLVTGIIASVTCILLDFFGPLESRIEAPFWLQQVVIILGGMVILFVTINLAQTLQLPSVRTQLSIAFLIIAIVPLGIVIASSFLTQSRDLKTIQEQALKQNTITLASDIDAQLDNLIKQTEVQAQLPAFTKYLSGEESNLRDTMSVLVNQNKYILSYGLVNSQGTTLIDVRSFRIGENNADTGWFRETITRRVGYVSEVLYDESLVRPVFYVSVPVFNDAQEIIALVRVQYDAEYLRDMLITRTNKFGPNFTAILLDPSGIILAHTTQSDLHLKTVSTLRIEQFTALQAAGQLPPGTPESTTAGLSDLAVAIKDVELGSIFPAALSNNSANKNTAVAAQMTIKNWKIISGQIVTFSAFEILNANLSSILITLLVTLAVIIAAANTANVITAPINNLALMAKEVGKGNLYVETGIVRNDEIGILASAFDDTTSQLRSTLQSMEARVNQRTNELAAANALSAQRAEQLKTVSNVARAINSLQNLNLLLPQIAEEISKSFGYYHIGIFLIDPSGQYALLQATNSDGGQKMLARGHRLRVGQVGIVGYVTGVGKARIALDVGDDATFFNNPDLPQTRSEMALPLKAGSNVIGALDIQSEQAAAFSKDDIDVLSLLADQISIAIQNAQLFDETKAALAEAQSIFSKTTQASWGDIVSNEKSAFLFANGRVVEIIEPQPEKEDSAGLLSLPIVIRGETLGSLKIKTQTNREWSEQEIRIFQSIMDRLGFALENARLFRDAQRLVSKERVIGEITNKISRSVNLDNILQTAVQELGHIISDSEVTIQFGEQESLES